VTAVRRDEGTGGGLGRGLAGHPLGDQRADEGRLPGADRCCDQGQVDNVALGVATADDARLRADADQ
jgi:hypothetical protein